MVTAGAW